MGHIGSSWLGISWTRSMICVQTGQITLNIHRWLMMVILVDSEGKEVVLWSSTQIWCAKMCKVPLNWRVSRASPAINTVAESACHNCDFSVKGFWTILEFAEASKAPFTCRRCSQGSYDRLFSWLLVVDDHVLFHPPGSLMAMWSSHPPLELTLNANLNGDCFKPKMKLSRPVKIRFNWAIDKDSSLRSHTHM